ncbi:flagella synthesis protein FlgN [Methylococcus sp. EFPC2]|uniref:flagella synthesis protein FlgN n=1 Tax=Methylococcus sp. EFPC2 TaxID=2812648 RepID=UPI001967ADC8|nr:flagellar protein FlgN [Methylococcus sp. EFPC2]QSA98378.1 flagellar protein FlgN [Methylococcus sp. EFPC2]
MSNDITTLGAQFDALHQRLSAMHDLLVCETEQLKLRDAEGLVATGKAKAALASEIDGITDVQNTLLGRYKLPPGREGIEILLNALPPEAPAALKLRKIWQEIRAVGNECRRLNEINGAYIGLLGKHVDRALDLLHGRDTLEFVYGPDGASRKPYASRKLTSA